MNDSTTEDFEVESNEAATAAMASMSVEEPDAEVDETLEPEPVAAAPVTDDKPKIDKRTKEGRKASIQAEIDELTATKYTTKRELEAAQADLAALRLERERLNAPAKPEASARPAVDPADPEPDPATFEAGEYDPKYLRAVGRWEARQEIKAADASRNQREQQHAFQSAVVRVTEAGRKAHADYDAVIQSADKAGLAFPVAAVDAIFHEPFGHELAYDLAAHPDDLRRLASLPAPVAAREVGKRLQRLEAAHSGPASDTKVSSAKAPIKPVDASPVAVESDEYSDDEPIERFISRENSALAKRRR